MKDDRQEKRVARQHNIFTRTPEGLSYFSMSSGAASEIPHLIEGRPLVLLAGWLGSEKHHLKRYEKLYRKMGFQVVIRIPSPRLVIQAATQMVGEKHRLCNRIASTRSIQQEQQQQILSSSSFFATMEELAWATLRQVGASKCSVFIVHAFSNGGCFLWEQIRNILMLSSTFYNGMNNVDNKQVLPSSSLKDEISRLKQKLVGVVFDSCPCPLDKLDHAMKYCSIWDQTKFHIQKMYYGGSVDHSRNQQKRQQQYWLNMKHDSIGVPQLYLNSKDDPLAPFELLNDLISHRKNVRGKEMIWCRTWDSSPHVSHFLKHNDEYTIALETFVERCLYHQEKPSSRL